MIEYWLDSSTTSSDFHSVASNACTSSYIYCRIFRPYQIIVPIPERWSKEDMHEFVQLVNQRTHSGWEIDIVIWGDIALCDPAINVVPLERFAVILEKDVLAKEKELVVSFFRQHPFQEEEV